MILRKPYAILIKNFRLIHFVMSLLMSYLFYKTSEILSFFNDYLSNASVTINHDVTTSLYPPILVVVIALIIISSIVILYLMKFKEKPVKFYLYTIFAYMVIAIYYYVSYTSVQSLELGLMDVRTLKLLHDFALIMLVIQGLSFIMTIVRTTGFDIKNFNFKKDLEELNIETSDNEEFEVGVELDTDKFKRNMNRNFRHAKYVYVENKLLLNIIIVFLLGLVSTFLYLNYTVFNKVYKLGDTINTNMFVFTFTDSYNTKYDYKGVSLKDQYELVVIKMNLKKMSKTEKLETGRFYLEINGYKYYHIVDYREKIVDLGIVYNKQNLTNDFSEYLLVFEVPSKQINKEMILKYTDTNKEVFEISIESSDLNEIEKKGEYNMLDHVIFDESILGNTEFRIDSYEIASTYALPYDYCVNGECYSAIEYLTLNTGNSASNMILKLNGYLSIDEDVATSKFNSMYKFIKYFGNIKYQVNGETKTVKLNQLVPKKTTDINCYIEVNSDILYADRIFIEFNVRNKIYIYNLK